MDQAGRVLGNEAELVAHLQRAVDVWNRRHCFRGSSEDASACHVLYRLQTIEFSNVHFTQQVLCPREQDYTGHMP